MTKRLLVATRKGLFILSRGNSGEWRISHRSFLGDAVSMVLHDHRDDALYAALNLGHFGVKLHRSADGGERWEEINTPSYKGIDAVTESDKQEEKGVSLALIWSLETGAPGTLWAGTLPGGLFKSRDGGQSWQLAESLWRDPLRAQWFGGGYDQPGIHSICVDPRDSRKMAIAVSCGGVWLSDDGGENWRVACDGMVADYMPPEQRENPATQDPHRLVQCAGSPDTYWVQHHNGIFRSSDACRRWQRIDAQPSSFGFAVVVHPHDPDSAWFVPGVKDERRYPVDAKFVVTHTRDGGKTFTTLTKGLPRDESYDVVYRHGLAIDDSGACLAMGSTTGNLWLTEDGGNEWRPFSNHFPPIYALRFCC